METMNARMKHAYIDAPKLLHAVKGDDFFEKIVPILALQQRDVSNIDIAVLWLVKLPSHSVAS